MVKYADLCRFKTEQNYSFYLMVFCIFGPSVIFLAIWFSIYSVLWIWSTVLARWARLCYLPVQLITFYILCFRNFSKRSDLSGSTSWQPQHPVSPHLPPHLSHQNPDPKVVILPFWSTARPASAERALPSCATFSSTASTTMSTSTFQKCWVICDSSACWWCRRWHSTSLFIWSSFSTWNSQDSSEKCCH